MSIQKWGCNFFYSDFLHVAKEGFFWGEWLVRAKLKINYRNYFFASLTVVSCFRLVKECMVKISYKLTK